MAREAKIEVERKADKVVVAFLRDAASLLGTDHFSVSIAGSSTGMFVDVRADAHESLDAIVAFDGTLILTASISIDHFGVNFSRSPNEPTSAGFDSVTINNNQRNNQAVSNPITEIQVIQLNALVSKHFEPEPATSAALYRNPAIFREVMRSHQRVLENLQETIAAVGENAAEARSKLEKEYWDKQAELARDFDRRKAALEAQSTKRGEDFARFETSRLEELDSREREIVEKTKHLDDRNNTHARRALHTTLKGRLAEHAKSFELTDETKGRRKPIHIAVLLASAALLILLAYSTYGLSQALDGTNWTGLLIPAVKPIGLTVALLGLLSWYLRWMNRLFERHADAEFQLKQFELDIDRASWVVETALEWRYAQDVPIPDHLLESISRNLFARGEKDEAADMHPADYLASALLGRAAGVKLKVPGGELEYGKNAFKDAGKDA